MSSLSPNDDGKMSSPRQTVGKKPAYYGRGENEDRGGGAREEVG